MTETEQSRLKEVAADAYNSGFAHGLTFRDPQTEIEVERDKRLKESEEAVRSLLAERDRLQEQLNQALDLLNTQEFARSQSFSPE